MGLSMFGAQPRRTPNKGVVRRNAILGASQREPAKPPEHAKALLLRRSPSQSPAISSPLERGLGVFGVGERH